MPFAFLKKGIDMTNEEKYHQVKKEAASTGFVLFAIIIFWLIAGFGTAMLDIKIFHMPLWVLTSCIGTWLFGMAMVWFLITKVFKDMDLEDEEDA